MNMRGCRGWSWLWVLLAALATPAAGRELAVADADLLPVELVAVQAMPEAGLALLMLRTADGRAQLPMFTGSSEAAAIERAWRRARPPRPLTQELLGDVLQTTGWSVERLVIDALRDGQFMAALELRHAPSGRVRLVDARPSDGLALALRYGAKVLVARQVFDAAEREATPDADEPTVIAT